MTHVAQVPWAPTIVAPFVSGDEALATLAECKWPFLFANMHNHLALGIVDVVIQTPKRRTFL